MKRKISAILSIVFVVAVLLVALVSCGAKNVDFFGYSEADLNLVGRLVLLMHKWIGSYGWTVVVFTLFLKIVMLPLDFWQRYSSRKSAVKMQSMQPLMEAIDKRFGANTQRANEEKQKLYKKQGFSMLSTCLPMILSMAIFFVMFGGLNAYSTHSTIITYKELSNKYYDVSQAQFEKDTNLSVEFKKEFEAKKQQKMEEFLSINGPTEDEKEINSREEISTLYGQIKAIELVTGMDSAKAAEVHNIAVEEVQKLYSEKRESWLWIKNVWQPDTWATVMPEYDGSGTNTFSKSINMDRYPDDKANKSYNIIRNAVLEMDGAGYGKNGSWNGLMILPVLSIGLSFLSMFISQMMEKRNRKGETAAPTAQSQQQQATNKMMMVIMPLMMAVFGFMYTGAFAIYMVCNYTLSILTTVAMRWPVEKVLEKNLAKEEKKEKSSKASYMR